MTVDMGEVALLHVRRLRALEEGAACVECGLLWVNEAERWRSYLTDDGDPALFCPECAEDEFGDTACS
jgi:hypothetical protein